MTADEAADALADLNRMLDVWWNDGLAVYRILQENFPLVAGQVSRTIGPGANFVTTRPLKIMDGCFVRRNSIDYDLAVIEDRTLYDSIVAKTGSSGIPQFVFYDPTMPAGTLYFTPVPDQADQVYLNSPQRLQNVAALATPVVLPPGYDDLVIDGLAIKECPEYGITAPADVKTNFARVMRILKRANSKGIVMGFDSALLPHSAGRFDIYNGTMR